MIGGIAFTFLILQIACYVGVVVIVFVVSAIQHGLHNAYHAILTPALYQVIFEIQPYVVIQVSVFAVIFTLMCAFVSWMRNVWLALVISIVLGSLIYAATAGMFQSQGLVDLIKPADVQFALILYACLLPGIFVTGWCTHRFFRILEKSRLKNAAS